MIPASFAVHHYASARKRFLPAAIGQFFEREFPRLFGPLLCERIAAAITAIVEEQLPPKDFLRPGQCIWNAVSVTTRPDSPGLKLVPVILTLIEEEDIALYLQGRRPTFMVKRGIRRMLLEAHRQGALLSMRDLALLYGKDIGRISTLRQQIEAGNNETLPHSGSLQDFGSTVTHKEIIIRKVIYEGKDPQQVSRETKHTQQAVDRYLKDFHRVRTCFRINRGSEFIHRATGLSIRLINKYIEIIERYEKNA